MVSLPHMQVPSKHMYDANILRADFTTFVPSYIPLSHIIKRPELFFLKQLRKWYASQLDFQLGPLMREKVHIAQISLNILARIPRKDTNPSHSLCPSKNLT